MRVVSRNVNGIRAAERKGFLDWLHSTRPDIVGLQEPKAMAAQISEALLAPEGYRSFWALAERPGYSGVALLCRQPPRAVRHGLGIEEYDREGRTIVADFGDFVFIMAYIPNGGNDHARVPVKMGHKVALLGTMERLRGQPVKGASAEAEAPGAGRQRAERAWSPDSNRRPCWLLRPFRPEREAYRLPGR
jgi:exodeoxyribonuclease III